MNRRLVERVSRIISLIVVVAMILALVVSALAPLS